MEKQAGQSLTEYGLIMALVAMLCLPALMYLKDSLNISLENMIPAPQKNNAVASTTSSAMPMKTQADVPVVMESSAGGAVGSNVAALPPVQVSGVNGDSSIVLANSVSLINLAAKYDQTSPELSNSLVKLGQLGQKMAQQLASGDRDATDKLWDEFTDLYGSIVLNDESYDKLSAADQALVKSLTNQSALLTANFTGIGYSGYPGLDDYSLDDASRPSSSSSGAAEQVSSNSTQTVQCGQNLKCN